MEADRMKNVYSAALCFVCLLLILAVQNPDAQAAEVTGVEVMEYGLFAYDEKVVLVESDADTAKLSNIQHMKTTLDIPILKNNFFSIRYVINTTIPGQRLDIQLQVTDPSGGVSSGSMEALSGALTITNIEFSENDPPGAYTLQILHNDQELISKTLNVTRP
jgi:hypothetical protein